MADKTEETGLFAPDSAEVSYVTKAESTAVAGQSSAGILEVMGDSE